MPCPLSARNASPFIVNTSLPSNRIDPLTVQAGASGSSRVSAKQVTLFPLPLSPKIATVFPPPSTEKSIRFTTSLAAPREWKAMRRSETFSSSDIGGEWFRNREWTSMNGKEGEWKTKAVEIYPSAKN